jgi:hypothetical protein
MRHRYSLVSILVLFALTFVVASSYADRPAAVEGTPSGPIQKIEVTKIRPSAATPVCQPGVNDPHFTMNYLYPPDDEYYTLIDPATCGCAEQGAVLATAAHMILDFPEACSIPVSVAIVAADLSNPSCPVPMRGHYLCAPVDFDIEVSNPGGYDFVMPLDATCCIAQKAFLLITFREVGTCGSVPSLYVSFGCDPCTSWNYWPDGALVDLCDGYLLGNPNMYVDAACCGVVPTLPDTWGQLKALYR